ncbi:MAG: twitching motility protein PilT [Bacteroides sp. SM23_62_1]|nr:MAG: twitching motility protein PilT [Bacteroides sp. SM23_62_1]
MKSVSLRFYEELNDFLPAKKRKTLLRISFTGRQTVKDMIESQGVPHTDVDLILVNGKSVNFNQIIHDGDKISVYPEFESLDISSVTHLKKPPLRNPKFILDVHLGRLARYLRAMGFDTLYRNDYTDNDLVNISLREKRIILTRDKGILMRNAVERGYWIRNIDVKEQALEITRRFDLYNLISPFKRCMECNGLIRSVSKESVMKHLQFKTKEYYDHFFRCTSCEKIYWKGSHYERMNHFLTKTLKKGSK